MKKLLFVFCVLLFISQFGYGQKISKSNPLGGNSFGEPFLNEIPKRVDISQQLLESASEDSLELTQIIGCQLKITNVRLTSGSLNSYEKLVSTTVSSSNLKFPILISSATGIPTGISHLPKDWESFDYSTSCVVAGETKPTSAKTYTKSAKAVQETIRIQIGMPIVHAESPTQLVLPITSPKATVGVKVTIKLVGGAQFSSRDDVYLTKGNKANKYSFVGTNNLAFANDYSIEVEPTDFENETISLAIAGDEGACSNQPTANSCIWKSKTTLPFTVTDGTEKELENKKISSSSQGLSLVINTTDEVKILKMKLAGKEVSKTCDKEKLNERFCNFALAPTDIPEGKNRITFEGESLKNVPFTLSKDLFIEKSAKPEIEGSPVFQVKDAKLNMVYKFKGDMKSAIASLTYEDPAKVGQSVQGAIITTNNCPEANGIKTCTFELGLTGFQLSPEDQKKPDVPVKLQIDVIDGSDTPIKNLDSMVFRLVNKDQIEKGLKDVESRWKTGDLKDNATKTIAEIAKLLFGDEKEINNETVKETFTAIKKGSGDGRHKVLFGVLKSLGSLALNSFGIPIRFN